MFNSRKDRTHEFTTDERLKTYPKGFPSGWYHVLNLDELKPGQVRALDCLGKNFVVFRGERTGTYRVMDAHCPHQGASLAGGEVQGEELACPFHAWCFSGDGKLTHIPHHDRLPRTGVRSYPVREHYGMLWMWHDISGELTEPAYEPEKIPDIEFGTFRYRGQRKAETIKMHLSEFVENSVDFQHFAVVHRHMTLPWTQIKVPGIGVQHDASWNIDEHEPFKAYFRDSACLKWGGKVRPKSGAHAKITLFGPGGTVWFRFTLPKIGEVVLFQTHLPKADFHQEVRFRWYADKKVPRALVWYVVGHWVSQWRGDVEIWENKVFRKRPVLISLDGPVHKMRRWYKQFYESQHPAGNGTSAGDSVTRLPIAKV